MKEFVSPYPPQVIVFSLSPFNFRGKIMYLSTKKGSLFTKKKD